jgi:hypothetical protein
MSGSAIFLARRGFSLPAIGCMFILGCGGGASGGGSAGAAGSSSVGGSSGGRSSGGGTAGGGASGAAGSTGAAGSSSVAGSSGAAGTGVTGASGASGHGGSSPGGSAGASSGGSGGAPAGATPSPGCGSSATPASGAQTIVVSGTTRQYVLTLPANYNPQHPYRLIFAFHGASYTAQSVADGGPPGSGPYYGIASPANGSAIFVAPQALSTSWNPQTAADLDFVRAMLASFEANLCVDESRVFSVGFSRGAIMTIGIGCAEGTVFRAIAAMSGEIQGTCTGAHPIAYWASHGMSDTTIPIASGQMARDEFVSINHCGSQTIAGSPDGCVNYQGCDDGYPTTWCPFDGIHQPPPFAGTAIWSFLSQF